MKDLSTRKLPSTDNKIEKLKVFSTEVMFSIFDPKKEDFKLLLESAQNDPKQFLDRIKISNTSIELFFKIYNDIWQEIIHTLCQSIWNEIIEFLLNRVSASDKKKFLENNFSESKSYDYNNFDRLFLEAPLAAKVLLENYHLEFLNRFTWAIINSKLDYLWTNYKHEIWIQIILTLVDKYPTEFYNEIMKRKDWFKIFSENHELFATMLSNKIKWLKLLSEKESLYNE